MTATTLTEKYITAYLNNATSDLGSDTRFSRFSRPSIGAFSVLQSLGVDLATVQLVWDFHTASETSLLGSMYAVYNSTIIRTQQELRGGNPTKMFKQVSKESFSCKFNKKTKKYSHTFSAKAYYRLRVPWYLESDKRIQNQINSNLLNLQNAGLINARIPLSSFEDVGMLVQVPCSVGNGDQPINTLLESGHSLFNTR